MLLAFISSFHRVCLHACRVCDLVLDAAEVELAHSLEAQRSADTPGPIPVPAGLQLMSLVGADTPMLVSRFQTA
jgi:hypothetical protein